MTAPLGPSTRILSRPAAPNPLTTLVRLAAHAGGPTRDLALTELLTVLHPAIVRFLSGRMRGLVESDDLVKDAAQETLIRIVGAVSRCRATTDRQVVSWSLAIARYAGLDTVRRVGFPVPVELRPWGTRVQRVYNDNGRQDHPELAQVSVWFVFRWAEPAVRRSLWGIPLRIPRQLLCGTATGIEWPEDEGRLA